MIPFTVDQFLRVFARYNVTVWPAQLVLFALGILAIWLAFQRRVELAKGISFILALFWLWMGLVYHFWFFSVINPAALIFAAFFVLQGMLFFLVGVVKHQLRFRFKTDFYGIVGSVFLIYALIVYPVVGYWVGLRDIRQRQRSVFPVQPRSSLSGCCSRRLRKFRYTFCLFLFCGLWLAFGQHYHWE